MTGTPSCLRPQERIRVAAFAGQEEGAEAAEIVFAHEFTGGVFALDGAKRSRRREQDLDLVLLDDAPEGAGIGRTDRLALIENGRTALKERPVDDVGMADDPAHV